MKPVPDLMVNLVPAVSSLPPHRLVHGPARSRRWYAATTALQRRETSSGGRHFPRLPAGGTTSRLRRPPERSPRTPQRPGPGSGRPRGHRPRPPSTSRAKKSGACRRHRVPACQNSQNGWDENATTSRSKSSHTSSADCCVREWWTRPVSGWLGSGKSRQGLISLQSPSEMTSTVPSTTLMAVLSSMAYVGTGIPDAHFWMLDSSASSMSG